MGKRATSMFRGMAVLGAAAIISKLIGTLQKIPLQNIGGDAAYGIYNLVYPIYTLLIVMATTGFPLAVSKFVAERLAKGDRFGARRTLFISLIPLGSMGVIGFIVLFFGAESIARLTGSPSTAIVIRSISYALLIIPIVAALRGYFQGKQEMIPTAISQIAEQSIRVATMVGILLYCIAQGAQPPAIAAGAMFGSVSGGAAALAVMLWYWRREQGKVRLGLEEKPYRLDHIPSKSLVFEMTRYAIPVTLGMLVVPVLGIADSLTLPHLLQARGLTETEALYQFGVYSRGIPLVQLVALLFSSMAAALVPAVTERLIQGKMESARMQATMTLQFAWIIGLAASFGLVVVSPSVNVFLFKTAEGTDTMMILALAIMFSSFLLISSSILQGWGHIYLPAWHIIIAALGKVALNMYWVPIAGLNGAAWATVAAYAIAAALNAFALYKRSKIALKGLDDLLKPLIAAILMAGTILLLMKGIEYGFEVMAPALSERSIAALVTMLCVPLGIWIYYIALTAVGLRPPAINELRSLYKPNQEGLKDG